MISNDQLKSFSSIQEMQQLDMAEVTKNFVNIYGHSPTTENASNFDLLAEDRQHQLFSN